MEKTPKEYSIFKSDDTRAFGRHLIKVNAPSGIEPNLISKAVFICGSIKIVKENPEFPYYVDLTSEQSSKLDYRNPCYIELYDEDKLKITLEGKLDILAKKRVSCTTENNDIKPEETTRRKMLNND